MYKTGNLSDPLLHQEVTRLEEALNSPFDIHQLRELNVEPERISDGMLARADGANWNPGSGKGLYFRENGKWKKVCFDCSTTSETDPVDGSSGGTSGSDVDRYGLYLDADGTVKAYIGNVDDVAVVSSDSPLTEGEEYFIFATRATNTLKLYINNALQSETATANYNLAATVPDFVLGQDTSGNGAFIGNLDDAGVLNKTLTDDQRGSLYFFGVPEAP